MQKQVRHDTVEVGPFDDLPGSYLEIHPFGRVPTLTNGTFTLFETGAITRYIDRTFHGSSLLPDGAGALAWMDQVLSVIDSYAYWPMVRQVFSHGYFQPHMGELGQRTEIQEGLERTMPVLRFLEQVTYEGLVLSADKPTLADCHLAPMFDYFLRVEEVRHTLKDYPTLSSWWQRVSEMDSLKQTDPLT